MGQEPRTNRTRAKRSRKLLLARLQAAPPPSNVISIDTPRPPGLVAEAFEGYVAIGTAKPAIRHKAFRRARGARGPRDGGVARQVALHCPRAAAETVRLT